MNRTEFQEWLSAVELLTNTQKLEAMNVLDGRPAGEASLAAIELGIDENRNCPHCNAPDAISRGRQRGLRRYKCRNCGKTFDARTGTPLSGLHYKERSLEYGESLAQGETVKESAERCGLAVSTAFRWRHRFLRSVPRHTGKLKGIVEADETYVLESRKGDRNLNRTPRRRGGKAKKRGLCHEQVPILIAADRSSGTFSSVLSAVNSITLKDALEPILEKDTLLVTDGATSYPPCAVALNISHETLNLSAGERVRGDLHIQTVNSRHSQLKDFLRHYRGVATKYLASYLSWFHLIALADRPNQRACLAAAMTR